jgi:hypothetical protein
VNAHAAGEDFAASRAGGGRMCGILRIAASAVLAALLESAAAATT